MSAYLIQTNVKPLALYPKVTDLSAGRFAFLVFGSLFMIGVVGSGVTWLAMFN
jgi:hypothetical protein